MTLAKKKKKSEAHFSEINGNALADFNNLHYIQIIKNNYIFLHSPRNTLIRALDTTLNYVYVCTKTN